MPNDTIHDEIESWLAADVHDQLAAEERAAFQQHLAGCASCRALHLEEKQMHQLLEKTLATESADPAFEQRMLSRFRGKVPAPNGGLISFFAGLMRMRAAQITAVAALLLTLVQVGKMVTGEGGESQLTRSYASFSPPLARNEKKPASERTIVTGSGIPTAQEAGPNPVLDINRDLIDRSGQYAPLMEDNSLADASKDAEEKAKSAPASLSPAKIQQRESDQPVERRHRRRGQEGE